jgi:hypothetical protein
MILVIPECTCERVEWLGAEHTTHEFSDSSGDRKRLIFAQKIVWTRAYIDH